MTVGTAEDHGYGGTPVARFGIVYEADWSGAGSGWHVVIDRVLGFRTAWRIHVLREDSPRMTQDRLDRLRELVADANARWDRRSERSRGVVLTLVQKGGRV